MSIQQIDLEVQSQDLSLTREKLIADFLAGADLDLTGGNVDATFINLKDAVLAQSPATLSQLQAAIAGIDGNMLLKGALDASAIGSQLDDVEAGWWYKVTVAGTLFGTNPIELAVGDNLYCQTTVVGTPDDGADFFKVDNTESPDILRDGDIVNDLTTGGVDKVLSAQQGVVLKGLIDLLQIELNATQTGAGLEADGTYSPNGAANYIATATSLKDADNLLDAQVKINSDALAAQGADEFNEKPATTVGVAALAPLANLPVLPGTERVYWNGLRADEGAGNDYTIVYATGVITMAVNMKVKDKIQVDYKY